MSVAAQKWAWDQGIPIKPKFVLVTLADQADERTGHVCYQRTDAAFLAEKCGLPERTLYRYLAALIRNGYLLRDSGKSGGKASQYWLKLDRTPTAMDTWSWAIMGNIEESEEPTSAMEGSAILAVNENPSNTSQNGRGGAPYLADQDSIESPKRPAERANGTKASFSSQAQAIDRQGAGENESKSPVPGKVFVIEGTRAWEAWSQHHKRTRGIGWSLSTRGVDENAGKTGWYFPTLFPPPETREP